MGGGYFPRRSVFTAALDPARPAARPAYGRLRGVFRGAWSVRAGGEACLWAASRCLPRRSVPTGRRQGLFMGGFAVFAAPLDPAMPAARPVYRRAPEAEPAQLAGRALEARERLTFRTERSGHTSPHTNRPPHRPGQTKRHGKHQSPAYTQASPPARREDPERSTTRPRQDSNLRSRFRKPMLYPLSYEGLPRDTTG